MCGIAGFVSATGVIDPSSVEAVRRMTERMRVRGPDADGLWSSEGVVLGHRRLAILDLDSRANQPMVAIEGDYCIVFNGEIYNFRELRGELESEGVAFRTTSDTEVLLTLFSRYRQDMLPKLRGMFAFAIWDARSRELFLARDPYGIKPLYYARTRDGLIVASQVKALLASGLTDTTWEPAGLAGFFLWGHVPEPWTLYRNIFAVPSGCWIQVRAGVPETPVVWNDIRSNWDQETENQSVAALQEHIRLAVKDSVGAHLVSDVPVSVFLSGGVDSGTIAGLIAEMGAEVEGITIGFDEFSSFSQDEVPASSLLAAHYGLPHHVRRISFAEFEQDLPRILDAMDQPSIDGVNTWFASKAAAERGYKVVLSGVGGDELFYGYSLANQVPREARLERFIAAIPGARSLQKLACEYLANDRGHPKLRGVPEFMASLEGAYFLRRCLFLPQELPELIGVEQTREGLERLGGSPPGMSKAVAVNSSGAVCLLDSTLYLRNQLLRDSDWASMHHSLELRTPLVDAVLLNAIKHCHTKFGDGTGKRMLASSPAKPLPSSIINRPKTGFGVPMTQWLAAASLKRNWSNFPVLAKPGTPWGRRWAKLVVDSFIGSEQELNCSVIS